MFNQRHRFHGYGSLKGVYERGKNVRGGLLSLRYGQRDSSRPYRVAVVVSKKVSKSAVVRNRIRRRVYAQARLNENLIKPGTDLVFTVFSDKISELSPEQLQADVQSLVKKTRQQP